MHPRKPQRGAALLTVLLLVAVMGVLLMAMLDDIRFGLRRVGNAESVGQAQWHALGAETLARARIQRLDRSGDGRTTLAGGWNGRTFVFPLDADGGGPGLVRARLADATACFNLNSVVQGAVGQWQLNEIGLAQYRALLTALGFTSTRGAALSDALVDWIDSDQQQRPAGAEDPAYATVTPRRRTASTLLAEPSELRAIVGYDPDAYARLRPHVCALPEAALAPVNVNTLQAQDAVILSMLSGNALDLRAATSLLARRPAGGWHSVAEFWSHPVLAEAALPNPVLQQVQLRTRYFDLHAEVEYGHAQAVLSALLQVGNDGQVRTVARRWGREE